MKLSIYLVPVLTLTIASPAPGMTQTILTTKMKSPIPVAGQNLGHRIDLAENTLGAAPAYVSTYDGNSWSPLGSLSFGCQTIGCGRGVAVAEGRLLTADSGDPGWPLPGMGTAAYRDAAGTWHQDILTQPDFGIWGVGAAEEYALIGEQWGFTEYAFSGTDWVIVGGQGNTPGGPAYYEGEIRIDGSTIVAGQAPLGRVAVHERISPGNYDFVASIGPEDVNGTTQLGPWGSSDFGRTIAVDGDWIAVGDPYADASGVNQAGKVYLYERVNGMWEVRTTLVGPLLQADGRFGISVSMDQGRLLVGNRAPGFVLNSADNGPALIYEYDRSRPRTEQQWVLTQTIWPSMPYGSGFGASVGISWPWVAIGAPGDSTGAPSSGAIYVGELIHALVASDDSLCYGGPQSNQSCGACPCGNNAAPTTLGGCLNVHGRSARLVREGSKSLAAGNLRLRIEAATANNFALLMSGNQVLPGPGTPCPTGTGMARAMFDGLACVGGTVRRQGTRTTDASGDGLAAWGPGLAAQNGWGAGTTIAFQAIYRDAPSSGCGTGINTTNAILIELVP